MLDHEEFGYWDWIEPMGVEEDMVWENGFLGSERMRMVEHWENICEEIGENRCLETRV